MVNRHKFLEDIPGEQIFFMNTGQRIRNIYELADAIEHCTQASFDFHSNAQKNDFSNWISLSIGDKELAEKIKYKGKDESTAIIKRHIMELEDEVEKEKVANALGKSKEEKSTTLADDSFVDIPTDTKEGNEAYISSSQHIVKPEEKKQNSIPNDKSPNENSAIINTVLRTLKNNLELFLIGLIIGILIGKFLLNGV